MARVFKRKQKSWTTYFIEYYHEGTQHREKVGRSKDGITQSMAKKALQSRMGDISKGTFQLAKVKTYPLFRKLMVEYLEYSKTHKATNTYNSNVVRSKHLLSYFGNKRINEITTWDIDKYKKKRKGEILNKYPEKDARDVSLGSLNNEIAFLKAFYNKAIEWKKIDKNPADGVKKFKVIEKERYLSEDEIMRLLAECEKSKNKMLKLMVLTSLNTGTRLQETLNIKVADVHFTSGIIYLAHTKKGEQGKVYMNDFLKGELRKHLKSVNSEYLFPDKHGKPYRRIAGAIRNAYKNAGIDYDRPFHTLRHTWASHMTMKGVDTLTLQELGRWSDPKMVRRYAHLSPSHKKKAVNSITGIFENKHETSTPIKTKLSAVL